MSENEIIIIVQLCKDRYPVSRFLVEFLSGGAEPGLGRTHRTGCAEVSPLLVLPVSWQE